MPFVWTLGESGEETGKERSSIGVRVPVIGNNFIAVNISGDAEIGFPRGGLASSGARLAVAGSEFDLVLYDAAASFSFP